MITKKIYILMCFQIFPLHITLFLMKATCIFVQGAFKNIQGLLWKIQGLFKDIPQISNFQGLFKARANHVIPPPNRKSVPLAHILCLTSQ